MRLRIILAQFLNRLPETLALPESTISEAPRGRSRFVAICAAIFLIALGVRLLYWRDNRVEIERGRSLATGLAGQYEREAQRMIDQGGWLFPGDTVDRGDVRLIIHPPGYSILMAVCNRLFGNPRDRLILLQAICDALAAVLVLLIAANCLSLTAGLIAALLAALSPHSSYFAVWLSPDTLAVLPVLLGVYLIVRSSKQAKLASALMAGAMVAVSCWLRANALLLPVFLVIALFPLLPRGKRLSYSVAFLAATVVVISPITIRNAVVYGRFIPLSVGAGITLIEGIADYDRAREFGMPQTDRESARKDVEWHGREDYGGNLWSPDGFERERFRFARGAGVIRENPGWFLSVMVRRAGFMLSYDKPKPPEWPFNTVSVPTVAAEPTFGHSISTAQEKQPILDSSPAELMAAGEILAPSAQISIIEGTETLQVSGDGSEYGDQFSVPLSTDRNADYVIIVESELLRGKAALKVTSADHRITLGSTILNSESQPGTRKERKKARRNAEGNVEGNSSRLSTKPTLELAFASGDRSDVRLVVSNNGPADEHSLVQLGRVRVVAVGATPNLWTRYPRALIRGAQKNIFTTSRLTPLVFAGVLLLVLARRWRELSILLAVPLYYLCVQSALHTEYRYILAIHYFLFVFAGATLLCIGSLIRKGGRVAVASFKTKRQETGL